MAENRLTPQQEAAASQSGRLIVSASAGSGKTFVMIERLCRFIEGGGDIENVLAVTFTKKAAAQMKDKLRQSLVKRAAEDVGGRAHIKEQLGKIPSANISTIHSFCAYLLRVYFYALGIDGSFEIVSEDGGAERQLRSRAMDTLFDRLYSQNDKNLEHLLARYSKKRSDGALRTMISDAYDRVRNYPDYRAILFRTPEVYTEEVFGEICGLLLADCRARCAALRAETEAFMSSFDAGDREKYYSAAADGIFSALEAAEGRTDIFDPLPAFSVRLNSRGMSEEEKAVHAKFAALRDYVKERYSKLDEGLADRQTELSAFLESGKTAAAFSAIVEEFDAEYAALKREEGKLDYGDLEHLTLKLLEDEGVLKEVRGRFTRVFVDEYQDVNPVQEKIISAVGGEELFLVGDVKQAIYGFRGSESAYFTRKVRELKQSGGALELSSNFRSAPGVVDAVNAMFAQLMREDTCGIDYSAGSVMKADGPYPSPGGAYVHCFGGEERVHTVADGVYSVESEELENTPHTREGLAVLDVVRRELNSTFYDSETKKERAVEPGDICILTRKRENSSAAGIYRALIAAGYSVSGAQGANVCDYPEVKQMIDILSYIDNGQQDIPMASAMLSPIGGFTEDELAKIKISASQERETAADKDKKAKTFRECCARYAGNNSDGVAAKIDRFMSRIAAYRRLTALFGAGTLIDRILQDTALEAVYMQDGGKKLRNVRRLAQEAYSGGAELSLGDFLQKLRAGGMYLAAAESGGADSIKIMTIHASKGLEFPVVILADVARPFRGKNDGGPPLDEKYGFAHKLFDAERRIASPTVLLRYCRIKEGGEEIRNEMNLLYVACTRAKYRLHIMSRERTDFNPYRVAWATNYAQMLDFSVLKEEDCEPVGAGESVRPQTLISDPDEAALEAFRAHFMKKYPHADSVNLPVKSSASAVLRMQEESYYAENELYPAEPDAAERGTAYHRYLQLCDFSVKDAENIVRQIAGFVADGLMTARQAELVDAQALSRILNMRCFERVSGWQDYREREFLCSLPANSFLDTSAADGVLVQGVIDLMCLNDGECIIIDYKYSHRGDEYLKNHYRRQLDIYRLAVEKICGIPAEKTEAHIVNIRTLSEIKL